MSDPRRVPGHAPPEGRRLFERGRSRVSPSALATLRALLRARFPSARELVARVERDLASLREPEGEPAADGARDGRPGLTL